MTRLRPQVNPDNPPTGDLLNALSWFETLCRLRKVTEVTEDDVVKFLLEDEQRGDLAAEFVKEHLCALPAASQ